MKIDRVFVYVVLCIVSWAFIPVCSKKVLVGMNSFAMMVFSNLISSFTLFGYLIFSKKLHLVYKYSKKDYAYMSFLGFLGTFLYYIFLYGAFSLAKAQEVFVINYLWPVLVVVFAVFILKEPLDLIKIFSIFISFSGIVVIATKGSISSFEFGSIRGDLLAFLGASSFALFSVLGKGSRYDESISVFVYFLFSFLLSLVFLPFSHITKIDMGIIFWLFVNGMIVNGISYLFWFNALKLGKTHVVSNSVYLTPFVSLLFIWFFLNEKIQTYSVFALVLIMSGITLQLAGSYLFKRN